MITDDSEPGEISSAQTANGSNQTKKKLNNASLSAIFFAGAKRLFTCQNK
jgi:hypothetical protein